MVDGGDDDGGNRKDRQIEMRNVKTRRAMGFLAFETCMQAGSRSKSQIYRFEVYFLNIFFYKFIRPF